MRHKFDRPSLKTLNVHNALIAVALTAGAALAGPAIGEPAPDFAGEDIAGQSWNLARLKGRPVVLEWLSTACPYVRKHYASGNIPSLQHEAKTAGAVWLSVVPTWRHAPLGREDTGVGAAGWLQEAAPTATLIDRSGELTRAYRPRTTPHFYLIDAVGVLVYKGAADDRATTDPADLAGANHHLRSALSDLMAGRRVAEPVVRPYGSPIRYWA